MSVARKRLRADPTEFFIADAERTRKRSGFDPSLPSIDYFKLVAGSDLRNVGVNVGLPYNGTAPDLGAFESTE